VLRRFLPRPGRLVPDAAFLLELFRRETVYWLAPLLLFLTMRLFSGYEHLLVNADQCKYLTLGRTFPFHQVDNHSLFLLHPPLLGYSIGLLALCVPLLAAGLLTTLLYACANFFAVRSYGRLNGLSPPALFAGLLFLSLDRASVAYDTHVGRVSIMLFSFTLALLAYEYWLRRPTFCSAVLVLIANAISHFVSDQALQVLSCQAIICLFHFDRKRILPAGLLMLATGLIFLAWPAVRLWVYLSHVHYPAGLDGTIEFTQPVNWLATIQPHYLPFTKAHAAMHMNVSLSLARYDFSVLQQRPLDLLMIHPAIAGALTVVLLLAASRFRCFLAKERCTC
jgi:hypothetical protein